MFSKCICFFAIIGIVCSASLPYLPRPVTQGRYAASTASLPVTSQKSFYFYSAPTTTTTNVEESRIRRTYQSNSATGNTIKRQQQQQVTYVKTPETASSRIVAYQQRQLQQPQPQHQYHQQLQHQQQPRYHQVKPDVHFVKYHTVEEVSNALVQQYGGGGGGVVSGFGFKTVEGASSIQQPKTVTSAKLLPSHILASHSYLAAVPNVELSKSPLTAASSSASTIALPPTPPNTPVHKNYAQNFLPDDEDVIPGSSYIPLVLKAR